MQWLYCLLQDTRTHTYTRVRDQDGPVVTVGSFLLLPWGAVASATARLLIKCVFQIGSSFE